MLGIVPEGILWKTCGLVRLTSVAVHIASHVTQTHPNAELSLAEASGKDCNARLLPEFQAPLLRNVWLMGYVSCALYRFLRATPESGASRPFETKVLEMKGLLLVNRNVMKLIPSARALLRK